MKLNDWDKYFIETVLYLLGICIGIATLAYILIEVCYWG